jgi:peptidoglycan-associated lipoprotein
MDYSGKRFLAGKVFQLILHHTFLALAYTKDTKATMILYRFTFFFLIAALLFSGCNAGKKAMVKGDKNYVEGKYNTAIDFYNKAIEEGFATTTSNYQIAESYRLSNRISEALPYYQGLIETEPAVPDTAAYFHYGMALKANGKYEEASAQFEKYLKLTRGEVLPYTQRAKTEIENLAKLDDILARDVWFEINPVSSVNSEQAEYAPIVHKGMLYFTSSRNNDDNIYEATGTPFTNIYRAPIYGNQIQTGRITTLGDEFTVNKVNEGIITFSPNGRIMIFARGNDGKRKGTKDVNLYVSYNRRNRWSNPEILNISDPEAWDSTPAFSTNGRTIYFASNRRGGYGGTDLYSATIDRNGRFGRVKNMGKAINTAGNEMYPFVSEDGKLYFASDGHPGLGMLDLFVAEREGGEIKVKNLGPPVNSSYDDFGMSLTSVKSGYFTSNRPSGRGNDDIYAFVNNDPNLKIVNYFLAGTTYTPDEEEGRVLLPQVQVQLIGQDGEVLETAVSNESGEFRFRLNPEEDYQVLGEKGTEYFADRVNFSTVGKSLDKTKLTELVTDTTFYTELVLDKIVIDKAIVLENIYYDLDKAEIRPDAAAELDKLVATLNDNQGIRIELSSHTDSRATDDYNMQLSQRRAESAVEYIISRGVSPDRLVARGYGETKLVNECSNGVECTEEEHQVNRRTEFKVIEVKTLAEDAPEEPEDEQ